MCEISNKKQEQALAVFDDFSIEKLLRSAEFESLFTAEEFHKMLKNYDGRALDSAIENMLKNDIKILTVYSREYPRKLYHLAERPLILYAKGDLSLLEEKSVAIVGTRMPSNYGKLVTEKFAKELAEAGAVIISGLCYGIDEIAHRSTLEVGGKTIAIVGSGFNKIYPATNTPLAKEIAEKGLLLSEYPPSFQPKRYTFPKRNRIVAGLSDGVLVVEAAFKSGTVHTKEYAAEYNKDLFAIPGNINSNKSELTNFLIKTGQGVCVTCPEDIMKAYNFKKNEKSKKVISLNFDEQTIVNLLTDGEKNFDYLSENSKIPTNILNVCLTSLEIRGLIRKLPAQFYALIK